MIMAMRTGLTDSIVLTVPMVIILAAILILIITDQVSASQLDLDGDGEAAAGDGLTTHTGPIMDAADTGVDIMADTGHRMVGDTTTVIITVIGMVIMPVEESEIITPPTMDTEDPMKGATIQATLEDHMATMAVDQVALYSADHWQVTMMPTSEPQEVLGMHLQEMVLKLLPKVIRR